MKVELEIGLYSEMHDFFHTPERHKVLLGGRRTGKTISLIYYMLQRIFAEPKKSYRFLFLDTSYSQVSKYFENLILPILEKLPADIWHFNNQRQDLYILKSQILFRTNTLVGNLVGLEYDIIGINEAAFVITNEYLYNNILSPMLLNRKGSFIIMGSPTYASSYFKELSEKVEKGELKNYAFMRINSFQTPYLEREEIEAMIENMDSASVQSEIYAYWSKSSDSSFIYTFSEKKHLYTLNEDLSDRWLHLSFDFNVNPMSCLLYIIEDDTLKIVAELSQMNSNIDMFCDLIMKTINIRKILTITGDASGSNNSAHSSQNFYQVMLSRLDLNKYQFKVPMSNARHIYSRICCNTAFEKKNILINSSCKHLLMDFKKTNINAEQSIDKKHYDGHMLDCFRYLCHLNFTLKDIL